MKVLNAIKKVFDKILEILGIATLGIMTVLVVYQVVTRYVFNKPSGFSEATSQYLFVWMIMFGSAYVYGSKEHLTIDILKDKFSPKVNMFVEIFTNLCLFAFIFVVCVLGGWKYTSGQAVQTDPTLHISMAVLYFSVPFTGIVTLYYAIYNSCLAVFNYKNHIRILSDAESGTA